MEQGAALEASRVDSAEVDAGRLPDARQAAREGGEEEHREQQRRDGERRVAEEVVDVAPRHRTRHRPEAAAGHVRSIWVRRAEDAASSATSARPPAQAK